MRNRILISAIVVGLFFALITVANAQAEEITSMIRSEAGEAQSSFVARNSFKSFFCEAGTTRVDGVDLNFTSTSSDDVYFAYCVKTNLQPAPVITPIVPVVDTTTATATAVATPAVVVVEPQKIETAISAPVVAQQAQPVETKTATIETATVLSFATPQVITITKDKNGKLIIIKKPITVKVRKAVKK